MNEGSRLSKKIPWLTGNSRSKALEVFLDSLPLAGLLVDSKSWQILHANPVFLDFANYTRSELIGSPFQALFADVESIGEPESESTSAFFIGKPFIRRLVRSDRRQVRVRLNLGPIKNNDELLLLTLEPVELLPEIQQLNSPSQFWDYVRRLIQTENDQDIRAALSQMLEVIANLSGAECLMVYHLSDNSPEVNQLACHGDCGLLPKILSLQDLVSLNQPRLWETGKHPSCSLYRAARTSGLNYLASAPVGKKTAMVGLVTLAGSHSAPPESILEIAELLAASVESIFQNHAQREYYSKELEVQTFQSRRLVTIADRVHEGVIQLSPDLSIRALNPAMENFLGYLGREVSGQPVEKILIGNEMLKPALRLAQKGEAVLHMGEMRLFRRNGDSFQALVRIFPLVQDQQVVEILVFVEDLTIQEQFRLQAQELENRALMGELMAVFAHEVRNPINNISAGLQLMATDLPPEDPQQASITRMLQDCDRLAELIRTFLAASKREEYRMENLDPGLVVSRLLDRIRPRIARQKVTCDLQIEPGCPQIAGDLRALEQVLNNLINNAVQAMEDKGGTLSLKVHSIVSKEGLNYVEICVADTGPGIPKEMQDRIFQPFLTTKPNGTGLGLSIAKRIITAHRGDIRLSSFPGGTIFYIRLPAIELHERKP